MRRLRINCDVDDVIANFTEEFLRFVNLPVNLGNFRPYTKDQLTNHDFFKSIDRHDLHDAWIHSIEHAGFVSNLEPLKDSLECIQALKRHHQVLPVTAPTNARNWMYERSQWLIKHGFPFKEQVHTHAKYAVSCDVFIDDKVENLEDYAEHNSSDTMLILFDQPWNRKNVDVRFNRAKSWHDILDFVDCKSKFYQ